jgi:hypothetical protein
MVRSATVALGLLLVAVAVAEDDAREPYRVVDTGQVGCHDERGRTSWPKPGQSCFGQDAQYAGHAPSYVDNGDGTVTDRNTGLQWQKTPDFVPRTWEDARRRAEELVLAGRSDWRMPTIKELFSIADFRGNMRTRTPYIDTRHFDFRYPDPSSGMRDMDVQYWSSNRYVGTTMARDRSAFGFNFADGRIKGYPVTAGRGHRGKKFLRCVRGRAYGENDLQDNGDGTITDRATGLTWTRADSDEPMTWREALAHAEGLELGGHDDWRLPNVKELQSIVDYSRAPDARQASARGPAIDPVFAVADRESWCWASTTHLENGHAYYVCFGQAFGHMRGRKLNVHGAGAVRSDPKTGDPADYPQGLGPQGDEIRIRNHVRCVRGGKADRVTAPPSGAEADTGRGRPGGARTHAERFIERLDRDGDGKISEAEFDGPADHFGRLDRDGDGYLTEAEAPRHPPPGRPRGR